MSRTSVLVLVALLGMAAPVVAQPKIVAWTETSSTLRLQVGETRLLLLSDKVIRLAVADPTVADAQVVTEDQVLITAKSVGNTNLTMWSAGNKPLVVSVICSRNLDQLRTQLEKLFPTEQITVSSAGDLVILSGTVGDLRIPARAAELATLYSRRSRTRSKTRAINRSSSRSDSPRSRAVGCASSE